MIETQPSKNMEWYLGRIRTTLSYEGISGLLIRSVAFLGYKTGIWFVGWYIKPIVESAESMVHDTAIDIVELTMTDVDDCIACNPGVTVEIYSKRLQAGSRCYAVRMNNQIVTTSWVATNRVWIDFIRREMTLSKSEVYIYDSYTHPEYRGKRLQAVMLQQVLAQYRKAGYRQIGVIIAPENRSNIKSRTRSGFKRSHWIFAIKAGRFHWDSLMDSR